MRAYITSIGEPTTKLCVWALQRNGFETILLEDPTTTLWEKMKFIYKSADNDFVRVDADVIVNRNFTPEMMRRIETYNLSIWWWQFVTFDLLKLDINHSMSYHRKQCILTLRENIDNVMDSYRPETDMSRIPAFHAPRRFETYSDELMGLHGYKADLKRVKALKELRKQQDLYDFELYERLTAL